MRLLRRLGFVVVLMVGTSLGAQPVPAKVCVFGGGKTPSAQPIADSVNDFKKQVGEKFARTMRVVETREDADVSIEVVDREGNLFSKSLTVIMHYRGGSTDKLLEFDNKKYGAIVAALLKKLDAWIKDTHDGVVGLAPEALRAMPLQVHMDIQDLKQIGAAPRANAASDLGGIGEAARAAIPALVDVLDDSQLLVNILNETGPRTPVWRFAAQAILKIEGPEPLIDALATSANDGVRAGAASGLDQVRAPAAESALSVAVRGDRSSRVRKAAAASLGEIRARTGVDALIAALGDADKGVREEAARALRTISGVDHGLDAARWAAWAHDQR